MALTQVPQGMLDTAVIPLGVGQTWTNVTASRATGTNYTNTTGRPIWVAVNLTGGGANASIFLVDGYYQNLSCGGTTTFSSAVCGLVPNGSVYRVSAGAGSPSINQWMEYK